MLAADVVEYSRSAAPSGNAFDNNEDHRQRRQPVPRRVTVLSAGVGGTGSAGALTGEM
jgi:hypothetical protein